MWWVATVNHLHAQLQLTPHYKIYRHSLITPKLKRERCRWLACHRWYPHYASLVLLHHSHSLILLALCCLSHYMWLQSKECCQTAVSTHQVTPNINTKVKSKQLWIIIQWRSTDLDSILSQRLWMLIAEDQNQGLYYRKIWFQSPLLIVSIVLYNPMYLPGQEYLVTTSIKSLWQSWSHVT